MVENKNIKSFWGEEWKEIEFNDLKFPRKYLISNYGRVVSYFRSNEGRMLKLSPVNGYKVFNYKNKDGKSITNYIHRLVAQKFLPSPKDDEKFVIHLDNNKKNNYYKNLKWVNKTERFKHQSKFEPIWEKSPFRSYSKLTETQVKLIKRKINDPNRKTRMKIIARRYGISEMQLYRIKSGENWGSVKPD
ncbi:MAG: NUMOD4 domain-containing protein [Bacteroidota bacterium]|nr:NUMOD4 domain-containing protein [Bacteroidota bacterium]